MQRELRRTLTSFLAACVWLALNASASGSPEAVVISDKPSRLVATSADGSLAAIVTKDSVIAYDLKRDVILYDLPLDDLEAPTAIAVTGEARCVAWGTASGDVILRSIPKADDYGTIHAVQGGGVSDLAFADTGGMLAVGATDGEVSVWLSRNSAARAKFKGEGGPVRDIGWVRDLNAMLTLGGDGRVRMANLDKFEHNPLSEKDTTTTLSFAQAEALSLIFTADADGRVQVRGLSTPDDPATLPMKPAPGCRIVASSDGAWLALLAKDKPVTYVRLSNGHTLTGDPLEDVAFSPIHGVAVEVGAFGARSSRIGEAKEAPKEDGHAGHDHEGVSH